ncbi:hypothetical protein D1AOALGA4SA_1796 [Olavius algarvensis Delta 1 endosymbiont]|nr:hypothetical protein D1AOALGA4SA_1796 [Olavius algarvensis Delta 1 endosymbiont]
MIDLNQRYQRNENFVFRRIENETILVPIKDKVGDMGSIYNLNEVGALVWEQLDGRRTLGEIGDKIVAQFEVETREAQADICEFIEQLETINAVVGMPGNTDEIPNP